MTPSTRARALWWAALAVALLPRPWRCLRRAVATLRQRRVIRRRHRPRGYVPVELRAMGWRWVPRR